MKNIKAIDNLVVSQYCNYLRAFFLEQGFCELTLYNTTHFEITNTNQIRISTNDFLRNTTEPDIWNLGVQEYDKFFCISSLFRNEDLSSPIHKNEFKIIDFYIKNSSEQSILAVAFNALSFLEFQLHLPSLSKLPVEACLFESFTAIGSYRTPSILKVQDYPIEESFYDAVDPVNGKIMKGELFFFGGDKPIEVSVFGKVGENINSTNRIKDFEFKVQNIEGIDLFGMCFGIERIIMCYELLRLKYEYTLTK